MKSSLLSILAASALLSDPIMYSSEPPRSRRRYNSQKNNYKKPDKFILPTIDNHKGQTSEVKEFSFEWKNKTFKINIPFSYGNPKSRLKAIRKLQGELFEYIKNTPMEYITVFDQFEIIVLIQNENLIILE